MHMYCKGYSRCLVYVCVFSFLEPHACRYQNIGTKGVTTTQDILILLQSWILVKKCIQKLRQFLLLAHIHNKYMDNNLTSASGVQV